MNKELTLEEKAKAYEKMIADRRKGAKAANAKLTPEQMSERNKKASAARWDKKKKQP